MRSTELELLDTGAYTQEEYADCLKKLGQVGRWLGGDRATRKALKALTPAPASILDVGCGGGYFLNSLLTSFPNTELHGIDLNPEAISYAEKEQSQLIKFTCEELEKIPSGHYDVVISTLVCHHLKDEDLVPFINECKRVAKRMVILNDLHRHPLASISYSLIAPWLFRNRLITLDGKASIRRAFTASDWKRLLPKTEAQKWEITWHWAFRWIVRIPCQK